MGKPETFYKNTTVQVDKLIPYAMNAKTHPPEQVAALAGNIREFGFTNPVLVDEKNNLIAGHGRIMAAQKLGMETVPAIVVAGLDERQRRALIISDNKLAESAWDQEMLIAELSDLADDFGELMGFSEEELAKLLAPGGMDGGVGVGKGNLAERFGVSPFSVLNAREGWWQDRKRAWLATGIKSELGREGLDPTNVPKDAPDYMAGRGNNDGGSIFDPVVCELAYSWFSPVDGLVLDPFAGGSVRGVVAAKLGRQYVGIELRKEQVEANRAQGDELCADAPPVWHHADSRTIDKLCSDVDADFVFSCPPYADLEVYSDDPKDISNLGYADFKKAYFEIIAKACARLKEDRFACFVVGEVRDKRGNYYNFVGDTVEAFVAAGLSFYNEAILVTSVGSLPVRAGRAFEVGRKLGKTHQNVLVFVKGDGKRAALACGEVDFVMPDAEAAADGGFDAV